MGVLIREKVKGSKVWWIIICHRGRRKYVRVKCGDSGLTSFNAKLFGRIQRGTILDISSVGLACRFAEVVRAPMNTVLDDFQLNLKGTLIQAKGVIFGFHDGKPPTYVVLFDPGMDADTRRKIRRFIFNTLDENLKADIEDLLRDKPT